MQNWFEGLWDTVKGWIDGVAQAVWNILPQAFKDFVTFLKDLTSTVWKAILAFFKDPVGTLKGVGDAINTFLKGIIGWWDPVNKRFVGGFLGWLWDSVSWIWNQIVASATWVWNQISPVLTDVWNAVKGFGTWVWDQVQAGLGWLSSTIWGWVDGALSWLTDSFKWLGGQISDGLSWVADNVVTAFDGAMGLLGDVIRAIFEPIMQNFLELFTGFFGTFTAVDTPGITSGLQSVTDQFAPEYNKLYAAASPLTPEEAVARAIPWEWEANIAYILANVGLVAVEAFSAGQLDFTLTGFLNTPMWKAWIGTSERIAQIRDEASILTPLKYFYQKEFTPLIPPIPDLIRFVVREVILPEVFYDLIGYHGYSPERARWFWDAHWVLPAFGNLVDAFHRGVIPEADLDKFLVWHDYSPEPRPGTTKSDLEIMRGVLKTLIPRVDLRYAWEMGRITDDELVEWYERLGYEEDSELMAEIQKVRAMTEEIGKVRTEWINDYVDGYIEEETLRANLASLGHSALRQDYYVEYANKRRDRAAAKKRLAIYHDAYLKDLITDDELDARIKEILVDPVAINLFLDDTYIDKYKKPTPPTPEKVKVATLTYLTTAFREGIISEAEFRAELERRAYAPGDIDMIIVVEIMKKVKAAGE